MKPFTKINVVGTKFRSDEERQRLEDLAHTTQPEVGFQREPTNQYDKNAIAVYVCDIHAGYVPAAICIEFGEFLAAHPDLTASADIVMCDGMPVVTVNIDPV